MKPLKRSCEVVKSLAQVNAPKLRPVGWLQGLMGKSAKALSIKVSNGLKKITEVIKEVD